MSIFEKVKQFASKNPDKVRQGIDKIGDEIDKRTDGKYAEKVDRVQDEAAKRLGGDARRNGDHADPAAGPDAPKTDPKA
ncbi:antitoxin [uncultured Corynebacterium sp.]|uniref:antitoxin n=1 Tax=uncultured Corynebacterium sp. TaxID=159447 RepID=UPI0025EBA3B1|nr:antitoxin [uncultured Corynebacterium sp.]